ncbi:MAG: Tfp pilus assembly protein FimT/FimU [Vampirovibrionales bacterium]
MSLPMPSMERGFTLAEVVISLAVLGLIASLTLPSLFMSMDRAKKRAVFKETYQALATAVHTATMEGETVWTVINKFNVSKICRTNALTEGCTQYSAGGVEATEPGVVMATGATIFGLTSSNSTVNGITIGLENFPKKEYFFIISNQGEGSLSPWFLNGSAAFTGYALTPLPNLTVRPGEIRCVEQACLDMLSN